MKITVTVPKSDRLTMADCQLMAEMAAAQMHRVRFTVEERADYGAFFAFLLQSQSEPKTTRTVARAGLWSRLCDVLAEIKVRLSWN